MPYAVSKNVIGIISHEKQFSTYIKSLKLLILLDQIAYTFKLNYF